jgi:hypothetical protein
MSWGVGRSELDKAEIRRHMNHLRLLALPSTLTDYTYIRCTDLKSLGNFLASVPLVNLFHTMFRPICLQR